MSRWLAAGVGVAVVCLTALLWSRMRTPVERGEGRVVSSAPASRTWPRPRECGPLDNSSLASHSQSNEDLALFRRFFSSLCGGAFVEIGALDGVTYSNSLLFERHLGWRGVLIEGNPQLVPLLRKNRPDAVNVGEAVCREGEKDVLFVFNDNAAVGGALDHMSLKQYQAYFERDSQVARVPCRPMGRILREAGLEHVDLFSLDVEGAELLVLETMDWELPVHVVLVETGHSPVKDEQVRALLAARGFRNTLPGWSITSFCSPGADCATNEVFVNDNYPQLPKT